LCRKCGKPGGFAAVPQGVVPCSPSSVDLNKYTRAEVAFMVTRAQRRALTDLGYLKSQIDALTPSEAHERIAAGEGSK
jgi:hypothetical protein